MSTGAAYGPAGATELQRLYVAARLQQAYGWTCAASAEVPAVAQQVAPALIIAAQLYEARQYPAALGQLARVAADQTRWALPGATRAVTVPVCRGGRGISGRY